MSRMSKAINRIFQGNLRKKKKDFYKKKKKKINKLFFISIIIMIKSIMIISLYLCIKKINLNIKI
jgi:hypothetical protein